MKTLTGVKARPMESSPRPLRHPRRRKAVPGVPKPAATPWPGSTEVEDPDLPEDGVEPAVFPEDLPEY